MPVCTNQKVLGSILAWAPNIYLLNTFSVTYIVIEPAYIYIATVLGDSITQLCCAYWAVYMLKVSLCND